MGAGKRVILLPGRRPALESKADASCWDPFNQSLYLGLRIHLPGLLLSLACDRVAMHFAVETRYPFLDKDTVALLARLRPRWKLSGLRDKYLLRRLSVHLSANGVKLPRGLARRPKTMFRPAYDLFFRPEAPPYVSELLNEDSLRRTDLFDAARVQFWRRALPRLRRTPARRFAVEIGLAAVTATQMWYHTFVEPTLADLPSEVSGPTSARQSAIPGPGRPTVRKGV
jgi:asparagine synthase (glutamine-hydrolysing)